MRLANISYIHWLSVKHCLFKPLPHFFNLIIFFLLVWMSYFHILDKIQLMCWKYLTLVCGLTGPYFGKTFFLSLLLHSGTLVIKQETFCFLECASYLLTYSFILSQTPHSLGYHSPNFQNVVNKDGRGCSVSKLADSVWFFSFWKETWVWLTIYLFFLFFPALLYHVTFYFSFSSKESL